MLNDDKHHPVESCIGPTIIAHALRALTDRVIEFTTPCNTRALVDLQKPCLAISLHCHAFQSKKVGGDADLS